MTSGTVWPAALGGAYNKYSRSTPPTSTLSGVAVGDALNNTHNKIAFISPSRYEVRNQGSDNLSLYLPQVSRARFRRPFCLLLRVNALCGRTYASEKNKLP